MCELMISCKRHSTETKKNYLILRATCENGLIDKASRKFGNFWICKFYFSNLKWELLLTKKKYFRPSRCTMKQTLARCEFTKESHTVDMMGPIQSDTFFQDRLMLNGVNLRIKLNRAKNVSLWMWGEALDSTCMFGAMFWRILVIVRLFP